MSSKIKSGKDLSKKYHLEISNRERGVGDSCLRIRKDRIICSRRLCVILS